MAMDEFKTDNTPALLAEWRATCGGLYPRNSALVEMWYEYFKDMPHKQTERG